MIVLVSGACSDVRTVVTGSWALTGNNPWVGRPRGPRRLKTVKEGGRLCAEASPLP